MLWCRIGGDSLVKPIKRNIDKINVENCLTKKTHLILYEFRYLNSNRGHSGDDSNNFDQWPVYEHGLVITSPVKWAEIAYPAYFSEIILRIPFPNFNSCTIMDE